MRGWGGPLPAAWIDDHQVLQRKILTAMRVIGMTPVLPAFGGWVRRRNISYQYYHMLS